MAITSLSGVVAGLQPPVPFVLATPCPNFSSGIPLYATSWSNVGTGAFNGVGTYDTTLNGVALTYPNVGALPFNYPGSGNCYLARLDAANTFLPGSLYSASLLLCDRLWHNGGISATSTSAQAITSPTWPARDENGSTNGVGVLLALECSALMGAGTPTITVSYTNSAGVSGQTATNIRAVIGAEPANVTFLLGLQAGDIGVQSVQSITLSSSWTSGTINLVAFRLISLIAIARTSARTCAVDAITGAMPQLLAAACSTSCTTSGLRTTALTSLAASITHLDTSWLDPARFR